MLRWMYACRGKYKIKNEHIRGAVGVANISGKVTERRLKLFGHVRRRPLEHNRMQITDMEPPEEEEE